MTETQQQILWAIEYIKKAYGPGNTIGYLPDYPYPSTTPGVGVVV